MDIHDIIIRTSDLVLYNGIDESMNVFVISLIYKLAKQLEVGEIDKNTFVRLYNRLVLSLPLVEGIGLMEQILDKVRDVETIYELLIKITEGGLKNSPGIVLIKQKEFKIELTRLALRNVVHMGSLLERYREIVQLERNIKNVDVSDLGSLLRLYTSISIGFASLGIFHNAFNYIGKVLSMSVFTPSLPEVLWTLEQLLRIYSNTSRLKENDLRSVNKLIEIIKGLNRVVIYRDAPEYIVEDFIKSSLAELETLRLPEELMPLKDKIKKLLNIVPRII